MASNHGPPRIFGAVNEQIRSFLLHNGVPPSMIKVFQAQCMNEDDLKNLDRDDIEHLFKSEFGFTFGDRKRFWAAAQKLRSLDRQATILYADQLDEKPDIYEITDDAPSDYQSTSLQHASLSAASSSATTITSPAPFYTDLSYASNRSASKEANSTSYFDDHSCVQTTKPSSPDRFTYPVQLPVFSPRVLQALQSNKVDGQWRALINELVDWILNVAPELPKKCEYQAIGRTLFNVYPSIRKDGFRPWSHLCRCLTDKLRKERCRRALTCTPNK